MRTITVLLLALVFVTVANTMNFKPNGTVGKDAFTDSSYPGTNYGGNVDLFFGVDTYGRTASFIEFTELNDSYYQGATVNSAFLYVYCYNRGGSGQYLIGPCNAAWNEDTITWNTMVGVHETNPPSYPSSTGWIMYGVSGWVQNWLDGTWDNNGFVIFDNDGSDQWVWLHSSDYATDPSLRPELFLDFTPVSAIEEATWGQIKADF